MATEITSLQKEILDNILEGLALNAICKKLNISSNKLNGNISALRAKGYLSKDYKYGEKAKENINIDIKEDKIETIDFEGKNTVEEKDISVVEIHYKENKKVSFEDLFEEYDELYAITYSSSPDFIKKISNKFSNVEIIFGCPRVLNGTVTNLFASQIHTIDVIKKSSNFEYLKERIKKDSLRLYIPKENFSHEKIYILKGENKQRVILGSANMSSNAFLGKQRENIMYMDDLEGYRFYKELFETFKLGCSMELDLNTVNVTEKESKIEETPLYGILKEKETVYIPITESNDEVTFTTDVKDISEKINTYFPEPKKNKTLDKLKLTHDSVSKALVQRSLFIEKEKEEQKLFPKFIINRQNSEISLNGLDFKEYVKENYKETSIDKDIKYLGDFIRGFNSFSGDKRHSIECFYKLLAFSFASPFFTEMRKLATKNGYSIHSFPMYAIIYGQSNAAKTTMIKVIEQMMFGCMFDDNDANVFTQTNIFKLKHVMQGVPITINDLDGKRWSSNAGPIIKSDNFGIVKNRETNSPVCLITSNDISAIKPELSKRCIALNVSAKIDNINGTKNEKIINDVISNISPLLYIEYLNIFIPKLNKMVENMENNIAPDIFRISTESIVELYKKYNGNVPSYIVPLSYKDYFGAEVIGYNVINELKIEYKYNRQAFKPDRKRNILIVEFENISKPIQMAKELPNILDCKVTGKRISMNLKEAEKILGINFTVASTLQSFIPNTKKQMKAFKKKKNVNNAKYKNNKAKIF